MNQKNWFKPGNTFGFKKGNIPWNKGKISICKIEKCGKKAHGHNFCKKHYLRWYHYKSPYFTKTAPKGNGWTMRGYKLFQKNNIVYLEHRVIMEKKLGRKLKPHEVVHHIDGNPSNNSPDNLMVFKNNSEHIRKYRNQLCKQCNSLAKVKNLCKKHYLQIYYRENKERYYKISTLSN